jgi:hypothetical protein
MESVAFLRQSNLELLYGQSLIEFGIVDSVEQIADWEQFVTDGHGVVDDLDLPVVNVARSWRLTANVKLSF